MVFGRNFDRDESEGVRPGGNRPDCAYFLLLGLCGAAFLLTIGGILTYIAFNPGSVDSRPHSPLSHVPHFHHHRKHHDRTEGHYFGHFEQHNYHHDEPKQQHNAHHTQQQQQHHSSNVHTSATTEPTLTTSSAETVPKLSTATIESNKTSERETGVLSGENGTTPGSHFEETPRLPNGTEDKKETLPSITSTPAPNKNGSDNGMASNPATSHHFQQQDHLSHNNQTKSNSSHHHPPPLDSSGHHWNQHQGNSHLPHPGLISSATHHHEGNNTMHEYQAKQSLALAIIGPLCLLMGIIVTLVVGVFALKYDCDHEPEPNIAFLRLRSEMSLNFDPSKNNYELLMPASSSTAGVGSTHSIHPGGMPRC